MKSNFVALGSFIEEIRQRIGAEKKTVYSVTNNRGFIPSSEVFDKQVFSADISNYKLVGYNDLAYNPSRINVGSVAVCTDKDGGAVSPMYTIVRCKKELLPQYLLYFLRSEKGASEINHRAEGAVRFQFKFKDLQRTPIYLPSIPEQERIVSLLDEVKSLRATRERANVRMEQFVPALFQEMFGDLSINEKKWTVTEIGEMCSEIYRYPTFYGFQYVEKGIPVIRIGNILEKGMIDPNLSNYVFISEDIAQRFPKTVIELNDIVMAVRGDGSTGKRIGFINSENLVGANMSPNLLRFKANDITTNAFFLFHLMISREGQKIIESRINRTAKKTITARDLSAIKVPLPPLALQREFAARVEEARGVQSAQGKSTERVEALYQSMLSRAFAGEL